MRFARGRRGVETVEMDAVQKTARDIAEAGAGALFWLDGLSFEIFF